MKSFLKILSHTFLFSILLIGKTQAEEAAIIALTSADNKPYEFVKNGVIVGFDIDLIKEIAKELGREIEIKDISFSGFIPSLLAGHGDLGIAAITPTQEKKESVDFSDTYYDSQSALIILKKDKFENVEDNAIFPIELLENKTIGVQLGTHHEHDLVYANINGTCIRRYDYVTSMIAEMHKSAKDVGDLYGIILGAPEAKIITKQNKNLFFYRLAFTDSCAIAFPKQSTLKDQVNVVLARLKKNGRMKELEKKWEID